MPLPISPAELAVKLRRGIPVHLLDVRRPDEHAQAALPASQLIPLHEFPKRWREVRPSPGAALVCYCHHGVRSWQAAAFLEHNALGTVMTLSGGIDAWSREIDPSTPRYGLPVQPAPAEEDGEQQTESGVQ
jgi:rhodanese-related sulfurtransferase